MERKRLNRRLLSIDSIYGTGVPWWLVVSLRNRYRLTGFVETGTGYGDTALIASTLFRCVDTFEIDPAIYEWQRYELKVADNVRRHLGSSADLIASLCDIATNDVRLFFYLDAHWAGAGERYAAECPLMTELDAICKRKERGAVDVVMIDNWGMFTRPPAPPHRADEWPNAAQVVERSRGAFVCTQFADVVILTPEPIMGDVNGVLGLQ